MDKAELARRVKESAFLEGDFVLRSGKRSKYYLDKYLFSAQPDILQEFGKRFAETPMMLTLLQGLNLVLFHWQQRRGWSRANHLQLFARRKKNMVRPSS